jgi:hypothetical protein
MSDESSNTSVNEGMSQIADQVDQAVAQNSQENQSVPEQKDAYGNSNGGVKAKAEDAKAVLKDPTASKSEKKAAAKTLKKLTLKIDGQEYEEELPFEIPNDPKSIEYMRRELQMGRMGQKRAQEKASIEKEVLQFVQELQAGGARARKALSDPAIGLDMKQLAAQIIEEEIENSKKSPEQLALEKAQEELKTLKEQREQEKKDAEAKENEALTARYVEQYDNEITNALESNRIPKTPQAVKKLADYMEVAIGANKDVSFNDLIPIVREELIADYQNHLDALPDDELESYIGKKTIDRIRKRNVAKAKQAASNPAVKAPTKAPNTGKSSGKKEEEKPKISMKDFFKLGPS